MNKIPTFDECEKLLGMKKSDYDKMVARFTKLPTFYYWFNPKDIPKRRISQGFYNMAGKDPVLKFGFYHNNIKVK